MQVSLQQNPRKRLLLSFVTFYLQNWTCSKYSILGQILKIFLIANSQPRECSTWGQTCSCPRTFISSDMKTAYCSSKTFSSNICKLSHTCLSNQVCYLLSYWNSSSRKRWEHISLVQVQRKCVFMYVALFIWSNFLIFDICSL